MTPKGMLLDVCVSYKGNKKSNFNIKKTVLQQWYYVHVDQNIAVSFIYLGICFCNENM